MIVWRLAGLPYTALDGDGPGLHGGRWSPRGYAVVYTSTNPSLAVLEVVVNLEVDADMLPDYVALKIETPDDLKYEEVDTLPPLDDEDTFEVIGLKWLEDGARPLLKVPSVVVPQEYNWLVNPNHEDASRIVVLEEIPFTLDGRLFQLQQ